LMSLFVVENWTMQQKYATSHAAMLG